MSTASTAAAIGIKIKATDEASAALAKVKQAVKGVAAPAQKAKSSLLEIGTIDFQKVNQGLSKLRSSSSAAAGEIKRLVMGLGGITAVGSVAGVAALTAEWAGFGTRLDQTAARLNIPVEKLNELQNGARLAGASADDMTASLTGLQAKLNAAAFGHDPEAFQAFRQAGIDAGNLATGATQATDAIAKIAEKTKSLYNDKSRGPGVAAEYLDAVGVGRQMLFMYKDGAEGLRRYTEQGREVGVVTQEQADKAAELQREFTKLKISVEQLGYEFAAQVGPEAIPLFKELVTDIRENKPEIVAWFKELGAGVREFSKPENLHRVGEEIQHITDKVGGLKNAIELLGELWLVKKIFGSGLGGVGAGGALSGVLTGGGVLGWIARAMGIAGAIAGSQNVATVDEFGRPTGNWGGADGEKNAADARSTANLAIIARKHGHDPKAPLTDSQTRAHEGEPVPWWQRIWNGLTHGTDGTQGMGQARNMRDNNPTNLTFAGQPGAVRDGPFAKFPNMETGVAADLNQYLLYQDRDHLTSLEAMILKATPRDQNPNVDGYIDRVAAALHMKRTDSPNLHDPDVATRFIMAVAANEGGMPDVEAVKRGVGMRLGTLSPIGEVKPPPWYHPQDQQPAPVHAAPDNDTSGGKQASNVRIEVHHINPPPGSRVIVSGDNPGIAITGPKVVRSMPTAGGQFMDVG